MTSRRLAPAERAICSRIRQARELLGLTQERCAREIGIERSALSNLEYFRSPCRYEVGLRFCRNLIISEEWLATGEFKLIREAAVELHGFKKSDKIAQLDPIFQRQTVDLLSEPMTLKIPPGTLYGDAFANYLAPRYAELVRTFFYRPRIVFSEADQPQIGLNLIGAMLDRYLTLLGNEAKRLNKDAWLAQRYFFRAVYETNEIIFKRFMGFPTPEVRQPRLNFLRTLIRSEAAPIGPLHVKDATDIGQPAEELVPA